MKAVIQLPKKVSFFCLLLTLFVLNSNLHAQIIYTDIPDVTPNATYSLDLNNDTIIDFVFQFDAGDKVMCKPQNNNAYSGKIVSGVHLPWALNASMNICDTNATWYDASHPGTMAWGTSVGNWAGATNKYIALKLIVGANVYYGWARLDVLATATSFTLKDYAFESTPNNCILSGQTNLGIEENSIQNVISIVPNPMIETTTLCSKIQLNNAIVTIHNIEGQMIKQFKNISGSNFSISRDNLQKGLYFIKLTDDNNIYAVEKLIIAE